MIKNRAYIHIYLLLWCLYWLQGSLYTSGGIISQILLAIVLLISLFNFVYANYHYHLPQVLKTLSVIICIFTVYGLIAIVSGKTFTIQESGHSGISSVGYLKNVFISLLPVYTVFVAVKRKHLSEKSMRIWTFLFLAVAIIAFYKFQSEAMASMTSRGIMRDELTNNGSYEVLAILLFVPLFYKRPIIQYVIVAICMYYVLIGMKRGAMLCGVVAAIWFLFNSIKSSHNTRRSFVIILLTVSIIFFSLYAVGTMLNSSEYFNQRLEMTLAGELSNRDTIYATLYSHFINETNLLRFLFGNGANTTLDIASNYAHNDWLEIAINNGLVLLVFYFVFWLRLFKTCRKSNKHSVYFMMISMFFIIYFIKTFFSMSYSNLPTCAATALGYALANGEKE